MTIRIVSVDAECNGLHGQIFAVAASVQEDGQEIGGWTARCPIGDPVDPWVSEHVLPALDGVPETHADYPAILASWRTHHAQLKADGYVVVCHIPWPVEARFLWDAHHAAPFSGPFPLIDVGSMLAARRADPTELDAWLDGQGIPAPAGTPHNPLWDARRAAQAYWALTR